MSRSAATLLLLSVLVGACGSTQEIQTSPPQPRAATGETGEAAAREAPFAVVITEGETQLPEAVSSLRFRITEVQLRREDGRWVRLPSDAGAVEIEGNAVTGRRILLDTRVAPGSYDSLAVTFDDVFVRFGENAGGPLATSETPQRLAVAIAPDLGVRTTLALALEPGASLTRSPECRWFFVPVVRPEVSKTSLAGSPPR